jgi:hypothetical protein
MRASACARRVIGDATFFFWNFNRRFACDYTLNTNSGATPTRAARRETVRVRQQQGRVEASEDQSI